MCVLSVKIPVVFGLMERATPVFPALARRFMVELPVIEFDETLHVS
jgi:hypothetical protein